MFELSDRQVGVIFPDDFHAYIESIKGKIECEVKSLLIPCLLRLKSGELLGLAATEFNLKARAVETDDLFRFHIGIGGEVAHRSQSDRPLYGCRVSKLSNVRPLCGSGS